MKSAKSSTELKVMLFIDSLVAGGAQRQIVTLARELKKRDYEVSILTYHKEENLLGILGAEDIAHKIIIKNKKIDLKFLFRLAAYLRKEQPDCLISYLNTPNFFARLSGFMASVPNVITSERSLDIGYSWKKLVSERVLYRLSTSIVVNAEAIKSLLIGRGVPKDKITVIRNGVDMRAFTRASDEDVRRVREQLGVAAGDRLFTLVGRLTPEKNHIGLLRACVEIKAKLAGSKILFVGNEIDGTIKAELLNFVAESSISERVIFAGPRQDMSLIYSASDFVVLPSLYEGFPNTLIEAMACETPVIASDVSDNSVLLDGDGAGYLVKVGDVPSLAEALQKAIVVDETSRREMGKKARRWISEICGLEQFVLAYEDVIRRNK